MFFYATSSRVKFNLQIHAFSESGNPAWLEQIAKWVEEKWGYIRGFPGIAFRTEKIAAIQNHFFCVTYANQLIGMFALLDYPSVGKIKAKELMYVYIDESFRGFGIGRQIIEEAKNKCREQGAQMIILDTLNPNLNHFYENCGASVVCESTLLGHPTSLLRI